MYLGQEELKCFGAIAKADTPVDLKSPKTLEDSKGFGEKYPKMRLGKWELGVCDMPGGYCD
jgi:hypothetical protein